jgi:hypothetical protein
VPPFPNFVTVVPSIPRAQFKGIMANLVACTQPGDVCGDARFSQISGFTFAWSASGVGQQLDADGNVTVPGTRVLDDGTPIIAGGAVVPGPAINVATLYFLAPRGISTPSAVHLSRASGLPISRRSPISSRRPWAGSSTGRILSSG